MRGQRNDISTKPEDILLRIKNKCVVLDSGCWEWSGSVGTHGRPQMMVKGVYTLAYRHAFEAAYGSFDKTLMILHKCDNKKCCNPEHLELGTNSDNVLDYLSKFEHKPVTRSVTRPAKLEGKELLSWLLDNAVTINENGCMIWARETGVDGYGRVKYKNKKYAAHRLTWALHNDMLDSLKDKNLVIRHCCPNSPNRSCCNPNHLKIGNKSDNALDMVITDRVESIETIVEWLYLYEFYLNENNTKTNKYAKFTRGLRDLGLVSDSTKDRYVVDVLRGKSYKYLHEAFFDWTPAYK